MTRWVEATAGGRERGPAGLAKAWLEVLLWPHRFFRNGIETGDQAPGLTFVMAVVAIEEASRFLLVADAVPSAAGGRVSSGAVALTAAVLIVAPASLHLLSALQTVLLLISVSDRGGVSETVQVLGYATAPCVLAGIPVPALRVAVAGYGAGLYLVGLAIVHEISVPKAVALGAIPAAIAFGYGFRGFLAARTLLGG